MEEMEIFVKTFEKMEIQDLEDDLLLEFDKIGMVELVSEWLFVFRENYMGFREASPALTFGWLFRIKF